MDLNTHKDEDLNKPENRTNLALFGILVIPQIHSFVCSALSIPTESIIYPCPNLASEDFTSLRPDFAVIRGDSESKIGLIEVELGREDKQQIKRYEDEYKIMVHSIVGKDSYLSNGGDLSLEGIYKQTKPLCNKCRGSQQYASLSHFCNLIEHYIIKGTYYATSKRAAISESMRSSKLIQMIYDYFGKENILENQKLERGKLLLNTVSEKGFSLRVYSTESSNREFSLMARSGGRQEIEFPSKVKLLKYFPGKKQIVIAYATIISSLGAYEIETLPERRKAKLPIRIVEKNFQDFLIIIKQLV